MSDTPKLPGLSGKTEAQLQEIHTELIGSAAAVEFDTVPKLTAEIKRAYAEKYPTVKTEGEKHEAVSDLHAEAGHLVATKDGQSRVFSQETWDLLRDAQGNRGGWEAAVDKPASLPKA